MPILVGSISSEVEATYGELLAPYLADSQNLFVISSDFCHWGKRFSYTHYDESYGPIHKSIEKLDKNVSMPRCLEVNIKGNSFFSVLFHA